MRDYRSTPQVVALANRHASTGSAGRPAQRRSSWSRSGRPGPEPDLREHADEPAEARRVADPRSQALVAAGTPASEIAVLFRTNGQSETYEQALADAGVPYVLRGGERFFDRPEVREARLLLRGAARSADADDLPATVRGGALAAAGGATHRPSGGGAVRERWESLAALARLADDLAAADARRRRCATSSPSSTSGPTPSTRPTVEGVTLASLHAAKGLEWDAVFVVGVTDGHDADHLRRDARAGRGGAPAALRRGHPGPRAPVHHAGRWRARPAGAASRRPSRFLDGLHASTAQPPVGSRSRAARKGPATCRVCGKALTAPVARKLGRCEDCPSAYDEALFERLREWRARAGAGGQRPGVRRVHRRDADGARRGAADHRARSCSPISGVGRTKLERYGADVLALCAGEPVPDRGSEDDDSEKSPTGVKKMIAPDGDLP